MKSQKLFLNLACGDYFISSSSWENVDWATKSREIKQINLLEKFPYLDGSFEIVYCSHFVEHIPYAQLQFFLEECYRVLKKHGVIRLVLPDFENIAREYIKNLDEHNFQYAEFNIIEMIDQCVRAKSGGRLVEYYRGVSEVEFQKYISRRTGYIFKKNSTTRSYSLMLFKKITIRKIQFKIQKFFIGIIIASLPKWYVQNHISNVETGELHRWVYDFNSVRNVLNQVSFHSVIKLDAFTSLHMQFPNIPLDVDEKGNIRKGIESMYIEAVK